MVENIYANILEQVMSIHSKQIKYIYNTKDVYRKSVMNNGMLLPHIKSIIEMAAQLIITS
jgi:hypothetical protein